MYSYKKIDLMEVLNFYNGGLAEIDSYVIQVLREVQEVQEQLYQITGTWEDCSTLCRAAKRLGITRQKKRKVAIHSGVGRCFMKWVLLRCTSSCKYMQH